MMTGIDRSFVHLASASPRRRELLAQLGVRFRIVAAPVDESLQIGEEPGLYVQRLAAAKASAGWRALADQERAPVLGADTTVVAGAEVFAKPVDREDAIRMLLRLSDATHQVLTGIALVDERGLQVRLSRSEVSFGRIDRTTACAYWETGEPADKAGAYAIQGFGACFVRHLSGSFSGVMGLPLFETAELLTEAGVPHWRRT